ncbi:MAG: methylmalonyl-CoA epimerase, partial [Clostridia bacterium]|nr:methylmalonyl-CoA epimerase [Clostridia bacterium]
MNLIQKIDHIGIAVNNLNEALRFYEYLGLKATGQEEVADQKVRVAFIPIGDISIELLEPTDENSPVARFLAKKGEGIHHLALRTFDIEGILKILKENDIKLIDNKPRKGAAGAQIAFIHPKSTSGVLLEL